MVGLEVGATGAAAGPQAGSSPWPWLVALVPPGSWFVHLSISYLLVPPSCEAGHHWWLVAASVPPIAVAAAATAWSWRVWQGGGRPPTDRAGGATGVALGVLFLLASLMIVAANVVVDPCR